MYTRILILVIQFAAYASIIPMVMYAEWWQWIITLVMYFILNGLGMIMTYHRLLTHRTFKCSKWFEYMMAFITTFSFTGSAITWIAIHRKHHRYSDTKDDPHSPDHMGWLRVQFFTAFAEVEGKYATDLMRDKFYLWQHKNYLNIVVCGLILALLIDPMFLIYFILLPAGMTLLFGTLILSTSHKDYKPRSLFWLAMITFGDAFHDIHHQNPNSARLHKYDMIGWIIEKVFLHDKPKAME